MILKIDFEGELPIYEQIKRQIIESIAKKELKKGDTLPSVRQLASDIGINLHTVNKAYNILKSEGYLTVDRRVGAIINTSFPKANELYYDKLSKELKYLISDSHCRGISKEEFIKLCNDIFKNFETK